VIVRYLTSLEETQVLASRLADVAEPGDLLLLTGGIGSGKTAFTQAFARALGVADAVTSPSFVIHTRYESGRLVLNHFDLYRLEDQSEISEIGIEEYVDDAVAIVEWADRYEAFAEPYLTIHFDLGARNDERIISMSPVGGTWQARLTAFAGR
jgi:tRNA threonylcarbamoyladenosine biosynthesis protein TsaE